MNFHKYGAKPTTVDGIRFASKKESIRYQELKLLEKCKEITNLVLQPTYELEVNGKLICKYRPDFQYLSKKGELITEDVKGFRTPEYKIKRALMEAIHGIIILET